jgi:hypothetical protein
MEYTFERDESGKRILGYNLENAEAFIESGTKDLSAEEISSLVDHNSEASNNLYKNYIIKFPNKIVNERDLTLHRDRFKYLAREMTRTSA